MTNRAALSFFILDYAPDLFPTDLLAWDGFNPATLFANGEQGGYWPADPAYLFEDSAGTIPASVNGVAGKWSNAITTLTSAVQATTANKPYLRRTPTSQKYWLDSNTATGALTATFASSLGSSCTIAMVGADGVTIADNQTVGTTYNLCPPYGYNGDVLIINRALTTTEKALLTTYMQRNVPTLGSELVTNGGFDTDTWWSKNAGASIAGGVGLLSTAPGPQGSIFKANVATVGAQYYYTIDVLSKSGSDPIWPLPFGGTAYSLTVGTQKRASLATSNSIGIGQYANATASVDNISIKAIL